LTVTTKEEAMPHPSVPPLGLSLDEAIDAAGLALAERFVNPHRERVFTGPEDWDFEYRDADTPVERMTDPMAVVFLDADGHNSIRGVCPVEVAPVAVETAAPIIATAALQELAERIRDEQARAIQDDPTDRDGYKILGWVLWQIDGRIHRLGGDDGGEQTLTVPDPKPSG
jgi:hypothetical protein